MPKISIIVPVYKVEPYLHRCVDSILAQTFTDFELILVDDGSPDGCPAICDAYKEQDSRVVVVHKENGGLSSARNAGLDVAKGEYISFIDSDDWVIDTLFEVALPYMKESDLVRFDDFRYKSENQFSVSRYELENEHEKTKFILDELVNFRFVWAAWAGIYKKEIIDKYNIRFEDNRKIFAEDLYFFLCYCSFAKQVIHIHKAMYFYDQREDSIMGEQCTQLNVGRMNELSKAVYSFYNRTNASKELLNNFPMIHYGIIMNAINNYIRKTKQEFPEIRGNILDEISDIDYFNAHLKKIRNCKGLLPFLYPNKHSSRYVFYNADFLINGNKFVYKLRCLADHGQTRVIYFMKSVVRHLLTGNR